MEENKKPGKGGKRTGAGRPKTEDHKEKIWLSFKKSYLDKHGKNALKQKIYKLLGVDE